MRRERIQAMMERLKSCMCPFRLFRETLELDFNLSHTQTSNNEGGKKDNVKGKKKLRQLGCSDGRWNIKGIQPS